MIGMPFREMEEETKTGGYKGRAAAKRKVIKEKKQKKIKKEKVVVS